VRDSWRRQRRLFRVLEDARRRHAWLLDDDVDIVALTTYHRVTFDDVGLGTLESSSNDSRPRRAVRLNHSLFASALRRSHATRIGRNRCDNLIDDLIDLRIVLHLVLKVLVRTLIRTWWTRLRARRSRLRWNVASTTTTVGWDRLWLRRDVSSSSAAATIRRDGRRVEYRRGLLYGGIRIR